MVSAQWRPPPNGARAAPSRTASMLRTRDDAVLTTKHRTPKTATTAETTTVITDSESTTQEEEYYEIEIVRAGTVDNTTEGADDELTEQSDEEMVPRRSKSRRVISKCFVCGLEEEGIPHDASCAEAFAPDMLPLAPVDPTARLQLASYRKYCVRSETPGNKQRSVIGKWTGGCSVRWLDLSGVYTQRACRRRENPVKGRHYVSKRMAKLELALRKVDSGCIVSPAATLVPFSRSVSLYARVHVCVCPENWCNHAIRPRVAHPTWLLPALAYYVAHS